MEASFIVAVIAALVLTVTAMPSSLISENHIDLQTDNARFIEPQILELLESLRTLMLEGSDTVPILDPFQLPLLDLDLSQFGLGGSVVLQNATVVGGSTFEVEHLSFNLFPSRRLDFSIVIPVIQANIDNYHLAALVNGLQATGEGAGEVTVVGTRLEGYLQIIISGQNLAVQTSYVKLSIAGIHVNLDGLLGGGHVSDLANGILSSFIPQAMDLYEDTISNFLSGLLFDIANDALADVSLGRSFFDNRLRV